MRKIVRGVLGLLGLPGDLDLLLVTLGLSGGLTAVTGWLASQAGENAHWALVAMSLVFAATMASIYLFVSLRQRLTVFERIRVKSVEIAQAHIHGRDETGPQAIRALTFIANTGNRTLYMKVRRVDLSVQGIVRQGAPVASQVEVLTPGDTSTTVCATLPDIKIGEGPLQGRLELEVEYGPSRESRRYLYRYVGKPQVAYTIDPEKQTGELRTSTAIEEQTHTSMGWFS